MPDPIRHDLGTILADMRDTGLEWLADAADTIEQTLGGQTYEYAVQVQNEPGSEWLFLEYDDGGWPTLAALSASWWASKEYARNEAETYKQEWESHATRIVRRPVGEIEVIE